MVVFVVGEVNGAAGDFDARRQDRFVDVMAVHPFAAKSGDQCWMNVQNPAEKIRWDLNQLQKPPQANQFRPS